MFHKLRLQLTVTNASIILILFSILIAGTYFFSHGEFIRRSDEIAIRMISDIKSGLIPDIEFKKKLPTVKNVPQQSEEPLGPTFFFAKTSINGLVTFQSSNLPVEPDELKKLIISASDSNKQKGSIMLGEREYRFFKSPVDYNSDTVFLFQDFTKENNLLRIQLTALIATGLICLILSFFSSLFMANRAIAPIQKSWQQQRDFLSDASHELRTPLTIIQTNLEVVLNSPEDTVASQIKWLQNIQGECTQMTKLVDSLLFLARTDANQYAFEQQTFSLANALIEAVGPFNPIAAAKGLLLDIDIPRKDDAVICGDEMRIRQVINILMDNAIRHTNIGDQISVRLSQSHCKSLITVTDSGEGIEAGHLDKIFDRFYQVDKSRAKGGAGLGLSIAKNIVESHNGIIQVHSVYGFGTTFTVQLPCE